MDQPSPKTHLPMRAELMPSNSTPIGGREISKPIQRADQTWADIRAFVRISSCDNETWSTVEISRPHVLIGRKAGCDITIAHTDLESVHTYLHFDDKGCHAIDLRTRTGMRINGRAVTSGRFRPGDLLEVGGIRIRLDGVLVNNQPLIETGSEPSPISMNSSNMLVGLHLQSVTKNESHWSIQSPIAFLGSEPGCAVAMPGNPAASRLHGVIVRTSQSVFYVDLASRGSHINGVSIFNQCQELNHNDVLSVGRCGFLIQRGDATNARQSTEIQRNQYNYNDLQNSSNPSEETDLVLARLLLTIQDRHDQAMERQTESQVALIQILRQVQSEQSQIMDSHLQQIQKMGMEITHLKSRMSHLTSPEVISVKALEDRSYGAGPTVLKRIAQADLTIPEALELEPAQERMHEASPVDSTTWLIDRVARPDQDSSGPLRDLIRRIRGR